MRSSAQRLIGCLDLVIFIGCLTETVFRQLFVVCCLTVTVVGQLVPVARRRFLTPLKLTFFLGAAAIRCLWRTGVWSANDMVVWAGADGIAPVGSSCIAPVGIVTLVSSGARLPRRYSTQVIALRIAFVDGLIASIFRFTARTTSEGTLFVFELTAPIVTVDDQATGMPDASTFAYGRADFPIGSSVVAIVDFLSAPGTQVLLDRSDIFTGLPFDPTADQADQAENSEETDESKIAT
jgi:hypothetical protein